MPRICSVCVQSDILCPACNKLLTEGRITEGEIEVFRAFAKLGISAEFLRCVDTDNTIVIVAGKDAGKIIGKGGKNVGKIERILGKTVDVIEEGNEKEMISKLLRVPVLGINKIYGKKESYKVRVEKRFRSRVRRPYAIVENVIGKRIRVVFE